MGYDCFGFGPLKEGGMNFKNSNEGNEGVFKKGQFWGGSRRAP